MEPQDLAKRLCKMTAYANELERRSDHLWRERTNHTSCPDDPARADLRRAFGITDADMKAGEWDQAAWNEEMRRQKVELAIGHGKWPEAVN